VPLEVSVFELDSRPPAVDRDEPHLDLAGLVWVGDDIPAGADVPAEGQPVRRLEGAHLGPPAFRPVGGPVDDVTADSRLEHGLGDGGGEHVVLRRLELADPFGERREGLRCGDRHYDVVADRGVGHLDSSLSGWSSRAA
jgi:hypothetical protein